MNVVEGEVTTPGFGDVRRPSPTARSTRLPTRLIVTGPNGSKPFIISRNTESDFRVDKNAAPRPSVAAVVFSGLTLVTMGVIAWMLFSGVRNAESRLLSQQVENAAEGAWLAFDAATLSLSTSLVGRAAQRMRSSCVFRLQRAFFHTESVG